MGSLDKLLKPVILLAFTAAFCYGQNSTCLFDEGIQDIRLVDGTNDFMGRVEIKYNDTWGTICDDFWSIGDAHVVCRMLDFEDGAACAVTRARFGAGDPSSPIWLDNVACSGDEECLHNCSFIGLDTPVRFCSHSEDAGVICKTKETTINPPTDFQLINSTTTTLAFRFSPTIASDIPPGVSGIRYRITYMQSNLGDRGFPRSSYFFPRTGVNYTEIVMIVPNLLRDTEYSVQIGVEYRYRSACFSYITGPFSDAQLFRTNATARESSIQVRLIPPQVDLPFMGRIEVLYNGTWGTVCDDLFGTTDANVICRGLGYERSLCVPFRSRFGSGRGPIWLDNLACPSSAEILEDCSHPGWGVHNCRHTDDVGVVCLPGNDYLGAVTNLNATRVKANSVILQWDRYPFPSVRGSFRYRITYVSDGFIFPRIRTVSSVLTQYELTGLRVGDTYNVTISPQVQFTYCFSSLVGNASNVVQFTTMASPPDGPPTDFHVIVLNSTAVEVQFGLPLFNLRNGDINGYIVFVKPLGGSERQYNFFTNESDVTNLITNLRPATTYIFSVLALNEGGQGPRSIHLTAQTYSTDAEPIIVRFGLDGNGLDRLVSFTFRRNLMIHCGTGRRDVQIDWFFGNGTKVGITDRNLREGHYANGTTVLQIAASRRINLCDGGVYTCVANDTTTGVVQRKNFTLIINSSPSRPNRPIPLKVQSTSVVVGWDVSLCDGGHRIVEFNLQYYLTASSFFNRDIVSFPHINDSLRQFTVTKLDPSTQYSFQVQTVSSDLRVSSFSSVRVISTLPAAPSPPREVVTRIVSARVIEVSWRIPAAPNGLIIRYTVYLTALTISVGPPSSRGKRQTDENSPPATVQVVFPGNATAGNVTVPSTSVRYNVQVTASIQVGDEVNEGQLSPVRDIFVPEVGLPVPRNVRIVRSTNSSVTLTWDYPTPPFQAIQYFMVTYTSELIDWISPRGEFIQFTDVGNVTVDSTQLIATLSPLTPDSDYNFRVSAVTTEGPGEEVSIRSLTDLSRDDSDRLAFLQIRMGPVLSCLSFQGGDTAARFQMIQTALVTELNRLCSCGLTNENFKNGAFSCASGLVQQVIYRGRILGTDNYSAKDLVSLTQSWIDSGNAAINAGVFRFQLDPTCPTSLDTLASPDCELGGVTTPIMVTTEEIVTTPEVVTTVIVPTVIVPSSQIRGGEVATVIMGVVIILLLIGLIIVIAALVIKKRKPNGTRMIRFGNGKGRTQKEDKTPFADLNDGGRDSAVFDSDGVIMEKPTSDF